MRAIIACICSFKRLPHNGFWTLIQRWFTTNSNGFLFLCRRSKTIKNFNVWQIFKYLKILKWRYPKSFLNVFKQTPKPGGCTKGSRIDRGKVFAGHLIGCVVTISPPPHHTHPSPQCPLYRWTLACKAQFSMSLKWVADCYFSINISANITLRRGVIWDLAQSARKNLGRMYHF